MTFTGPPQSWYEPSDPVIFTCTISGESSEDCPECIDDTHDGFPEPEQDDDGWRERDDDRWIDDHLDDYGD